MSFMDLPELFRKRFAPHEATILKAENEFEIRYTPKESFFPVHPAHQFAFASISMIRDVTLAREGLIGVEYGAIDRSLPEPLIARSSGIRYALDSGFGGANLGTSYMIHPNGGTSFVGGGGGGGASSTRRSAGQGGGGGSNSASAAAVLLHVDKRRESSLVTWPVHDWNTIFTNGPGEWIVSEIITFGKFFDFSSNLNGQNIYALSKLTQIEDPEKLTETIVRLYILDSARFGGPIFNVISGIAMRQGVDIEKLKKLCRQIDASKEMTR